MKLSLVLSLALLGAVSAHQLGLRSVLGLEGSTGVCTHPDAGALEQEIRNEQGKVESGEPEPPCPMESETFRMVVPGTGGHTCRYVLVNSCQTFWNAQNVCARCYRGRLASIHSHSINEHLRCMARARTTQGQVWIGGFTYRRHNCVNAYWLDRSAWNYAYWAAGNNYGCGINGVALCTVGGHWRSVNCAARLPFICEY
ncbi:bone marrow proteoglycan-like [Pelodiscus sinensis]|uniref:bone marrow proteoglycan-like n=1 Tax=Pelodiscus sinensis TaxID=13735 RepID=UPI003F6C3100